MRHVRFPRLLAGLAALLTGAFATGAVQAGQPTPWQLGLQPPSGPVMTQMNSFHDLLLVIITAITLFVLALLLYVMWRFRASANPNPSRTTHNTLIEVVWTVVPVLILIVIAVPSFRLLYFMDKAPNPQLTLQVTGYQWYWGYSYPDQQIPEFSSYMVRDEDIQEGQVRLLSVDNPVVLPAGVDVQVLVTAGDVLHSWALPSQGVKRDAVPGRMNETWVHFDEPGVYYGQCSEICGTEHGYMPIEIQVVSAEEFDAWVLESVAGLDLEEPPTLLTMTWEEAQERDVAALID